jgi:cell division protein FtsB
MTQRVPGLPPHMPSPELPKPSLVRQVLATPWLTLVLMGGSLFLLAMMAFTIWGDRGLLAMWRTQRELERLVREIEIVEQKNATLSREVQRLHSDLGYIEKIAREELGLVRPGEIVFEFAD